jgi:cytochrome c oxidase subunit 3
MRYVVEGANLREMNTVVNYLLISFLYHWISRISRSFRCNYKLFSSMFLLELEKRGSYEMVEKVGLYWHFVDLVWVFVLQFSI